jgi:hypothetical protein
MTARRLPWRRTLATTAGLTAIAALGGAGQLVSGTFTPPVSDLEPLGLSSWVLPGVWLAASVAVPCAVTAWLAWRESVWTGVAAMVAGGLLAVELVVQIPFVGLDPLQAVMGVVAAVLVALGALADRPRRRDSGQGPRSRDLGLSAPATDAPPRAG